jgi:hypothetical protein
VRVVTRTPSIRDGDFLCPISGQEQALTFRTRFGRGKHFMSYRFDFDTKNRIIRCRFEGIVTDQALKNYYAVAAKLVASKVPCSGILDMSAVTSVDISPQTVRELANSPPTIPDPASPRFIIAASPHLFGLARMFELQGQETRPNLHVVRSAKEVWVILGVEEPQFDESIQTE